MRSRATRLSLGMVALIVLAAATIFVIRTEKNISTHRQSVRAFDQHAREIGDRLADLRAAQQAYVAEGQGVAVWMPRVSALASDIGGRLDSLRAASESPNSRGLLMEAAADVTEFGNVDRRARDYVKAGQTLMASDVVFTEGGETASNAARLVESARLAELQALDASEGDLRRRQAMALAGAAAVGVLCLLVLAAAAPRESREEPAGETAAVETGASSQLSLREPARPTRTTIPATAPPPRGSVPMLKAAAELCTEFGRVNDRADLPRLMARAADVLDASGVIVWLGGPGGADLRPVLAYGYPDHVLARMPAVARMADNAAAAAYRSGAMQIVMKRPGGSNGALVAPLLSPEGCIGALTAEIIGGSETSEGVQAVASLLAAQITGLVAGSMVAAQMPVTDSPAGRIASG